MKIKKRVMKTIIDNILYILDDEAYVIEDDLTNIEKIRVPIDSFNSYCVLNPSINIIEPYNYRSYQVGNDTRLKKATTKICTTETNEPLMKVLYAKGLCANPDYMTQAEAEAVTNEQLDNLFEGNNEIVSFMEFKYFTSCTKTGKRMFMNCENIERIEKLEKQDIKIKRLEDLFLQVFYFSNNYFIFISFYFDKIMKIKSKFL